MDDFETILLAMIELAEDGESEAATTVSDQLVETDSVLEAKSGEYTKHRMKMRAISIEDKDAKALLDRLALVKYTHRDGRSLCADQPADVQEVHKWFYYVVYKWLEEQGADPNR